MKTLEKKVSAVMRWVGPLAIVGAGFAVLSDQVGLVVHLPEMGDDALGYHAVGSGIFLFIFTLLFIGMLGLYAIPREPGSARVVEYGDSSARYVLVEDSEEEARLPERTLRDETPRRSPVPLREAATRRHRTAHRVGK